MNQNHRALLGRSWLSLQCKDYMLRSHKSEITVQNVSRVCETLYFDVEAFYYEALRKLRRPWQGPELCNLRGTHHFEYSVFVSATCDLGVCLCCWPLEPTLRVPTAVLQGEHLSVSVGHKLHILTLRTPFITSRFVFVWSLQLWTSVRFIVTLD